MPKVLFIAYDFPPCPNIGGSLRSEKFAKYLPRHGWDVGILALLNPGIPQPEVYADVERIPSLTPWARPYQVTPYGWIPTLYRRVRKRLQEEPWDLIYVSCPPFPQTLVARRLKNHFGIPFVLDFRDAWSLDPYVEGSLLKKWVYRTFFPAMERIALESADRVILNTPSALASYLSHYPTLGNRMVMIPNGYDEEDFKDFSSKAPRNQMRLLYCGRFGIGARDPVLLLKALKDLVSRRLALQLRIIGGYAPDLPEKISELGLQHHVQLHGQYPHGEAIRAMGDCHALVLYQENSKSFLTPVAGKTHEYLRTGKPILAIAPPGDNLDLVRKYAKNYQCVTDFNTLSVAKAIESLHGDWAKGLLDASALPDRAYLERYNRSALTLRLAHLFCDVAYKNTSPFSSRREESNSEAT